MNFCTQGRLSVRAGSEGFQSEMGPWSALGTKALGSEPYTPDFDAKATGGCRILRIHADAYKSALRVGKADQIVGVRAMRHMSQVHAYNAPLIAHFTCLIVAEVAASEGL